MSILEKNIDIIGGVGAKTKNLLNKIGIYTIEDLLYYFPRTYEDRSKLFKLKEKDDGENISTVVRLENNPIANRRGFKNTIIKVLASDGEEQTYLTWFNQPYLLNTLRAGEILKVNGTIKKRGNIKEIINPIYTKDLESDNKIGRIIPIYTLTKSLTNNTMNKIIKNMFDIFNEDKKYKDEIEKLPDYIIIENNLTDTYSALKNIHFPKNREKFLASRNTLAFIELLSIQLSLQKLKKRRDGKKKHIVFNMSDKSKELVKNLPFKLTDAQKRVISEIEKDMEKNTQMNRLVQGDVGSGKTIVAIIALLKAIENGYQGAMMVPTEILARQHFETLKELLNKYDVNIEILVSNMKKKDKDKVISDIALGEVDIVIGTHSLIEGKIEFNELGLVITDEQHRFGVNQRAKIMNKGKNPDVLVMTATPIPRTLSLILYGDLDISIIDELPPGRKEVKTYVRSRNSRKDIYEFAKTQILKGNQVYVVCPLVEDSDILDLKSVEQLYKEIENEFNKFEISYIYGKMKSVEKNNIMNQFDEGKINLLISTTVIEVGINIPNANTMIIENAERFGLSQLHQLRGRVGRGGSQSYCILINEGKGKIAKERAKIMTETSDGFIISEKDLELRGSGEFFGFRQHGVPELRIAKFPRDYEILKYVQMLSMKTLEIDENLDNDENKKLKKILNKNIYDNMEISFN